MKTFFRVMMLIVPLIVYVGIIYFRPVLSMSEYELAVAMREWLPGIFSSHIVARMPLLLLVVLGGSLCFFVGKRFGINYPIQLLAGYSLLFMVGIAIFMAPVWYLLFTLLLVGAIAIFLQRQWEKFTANDNLTIYRKIMVIMALASLFLSLTACVITLLIGFGVIKEWWWFSKSLVPALLVPGFWFLLAKGEVDVELKFLELEVALAFLLLTGVVATAPILRAKVASPEKAIMNVIGQLNKSNLKVVADIDHYPLMRWITKLPVVKFSQEIKPVVGVDLLFAGYFDKVEILPGLPRIAWKFGSTQLLLFPSSGGKK